MPKPPAARGYARLAQKLVLLDWLHQRLGYDTTEQLLADVKQADEGFDPEGRSHIHARLSSRAERMQDITKDDLQRYDDHIRAHLAGMNAGRSEHVTLRYFQYLGRPVYRNLSRPLLQPARRFAAFVERIRPAAQREPHTQRTDPAVRCRRPVQAGLLDGNGQRQDAVAAPELPPVSPLQPGTVGQRSADYAQRRIEPAALARAASVRCSGATLRPQPKRQPAVGQGER